jgi:hypothetical protein
MENIMANAVLVFWSVVVVLLPLVGAVANAADPGAE